MIVVITSLAASGRLFFLAFLVKLFCLITNILFGIFAGVINSYYICSYEKDRKAKNGNTLHWPMCWRSLQGVFVRIKMLQFVRNINSCVK